ncbi:uncharacterized protein FTJAE_9147 [Fusarium tjaetaba]|uniref:Uncharacterized protein n=1 Tax=Fusarium tjaetaba TaxID=1567544 RepID=A0A8H5VLF1_9HYPO|nr:uncharacterized protein FTJAE_9147 [Fusarium tjaetaba]KAF5627676.1 hypothetical protein FTJAE_9147 [Fusarium tjaetaba]
MSSLKSTLLSTLSKTPKQHLKAQKPKYQLCSNPSITITDAETGEEWEFIDHDELDGDLPNSDNTRTLREELELNAREQDNLLGTCWLFDEPRQCQWNKRSLDGGSIPSKLAVYILHFSRQTRLSFLSSVILDITFTRTSLRSATDTNSHPSLNPQHHNFYDTSRNLQLPTSAYTPALKRPTRQPSTPPRSPRPPTLSPTLRSILRVS